MRIKWFYVRIALLLSFFIQGVVNTKESFFDNTSWLIVGIGSVASLLTLSLMLIVFIWVEKKTSFFKPMVWEKPNWNSNFLKCGPLHFFHLAAFAIMAAGTGELVSCFINRGFLCKDATFTLACGIGIYFGVRLSLRIYPKITHQKQPNNTDETSK